MAAAAANWVRSLSVSDTNCTQFGPKARTHGRPSLSALRRVLLPAPAEALRRAPPPAPAETGPSGPRPQASCGAVATSGAGRTGAGRRLGRRRRKIGIARSDRMSR